MQVLSMTNSRVLFRMVYSDLYENIENEVILHFCNIANLVHGRTQNYEEIKHILTTPHDTQLPKKTPFTEVLMACPPGYLSTSAFVRRI